MVGLFQHIVRRAPGATKNLIRQGVARTSTLLDDFTRQQFASAGRRVGPSVRVQANKPGLPGLIGDVRVAAATPIMRGSTKVVGGALGIELADKSGLTSSIQNTLNRVGPGLDRFFGAVTPEPIQKFGREMQQYGWGALGGFVPEFGANEFSRLTEKEQKLLLETLGIQKPGELRAQAPQQRRAPAPGAGSGSPGAAPPPSVLPPPVGQAPAQRQSQAPTQRQGQSSRASVVSAPQVPGTAVGNVAAVPRFDMTPQGQYDRYFTDNQMDRYFGGRPGANAPKDMEAMQAAAMLPQAPTSMGLSDYYRSQSAAGRAGMDDIVNLMGYTGDMERWARANPMIAQREFAKQFPAGVANTGLVMNMPQPSAQLNPAGPEYALESGERIYNFGSDQISPEMIQAFQEKLRQQARR